MQKSDFLGTDNIGKLLFKLSLPAVIAMFVMSFYNIVDTLFISRFIGRDALAGVTFVLPIQMIILSFSLAIGIGASSLISIKLGENNKAKAEEFLGTAFLLALFFGLLIGIIGFVFEKSILSFMGVEGAVYSYARDYYSIIIFGSVFSFVAMTFNNIVRAEGNAKFSMITMIIGSVTNLILDPIFIIFFNMGTFGAGLATIISQAITSILLFLYFYTNKSVLHFHLRFLKFSFLNMISIFKVGFASFGRQVSFSIVAFVTNWIFLAEGGAIAVASYGIVQRLLMLITMPGFGVVQGMMPILGYNYGAKKYKRVVNCFWLSVKITTLILTVSWIIIFIFARFFIGLFTKDLELLNLTVYLFRVILLMASIIGYQLIVGGLFQALAQSSKAFFSAILRQILFMVPLLLLFSYFFDFKFLIWAFPISDLLSFIVMFFMGSKSINILKKKGDIS